MAWTVYKKIDCRGEKKNLVYLVEEYSSTEGKWTFNSKDSIILIYPFILLVCMTVDYYAFFSRIMGITICTTHSSSELDQLCFLRNIHRKKLTPHPKKWVSS